MCEVYSIIIPCERTQHATRTISTARRRPLGSRYTTGLQPQLLRSAVEPSHTPAHPPTPPNVFVGSSSVGVPSFCWKTIPTREIMTHGPTGANHRVELASQRISYIVPGITFATDLDCGSTIASRSAGARSEHLSEMRSIILYYCIEYLIRALTHPDPATNNNNSWFELMLLHCCYCCYFTAVIATSTHTRYYLR